MRPTDGPASVRSVEGGTLASSIEEKIKGAYGYEVFVRQLERRVIDDTKRMGQPRQRRAGSDVCKEPPRRTENDRSAHQCIPLIQVVHFGHRQDCPFIVKPMAPGHIELLGVVEISFELAVVKIRYAAVDGIVVVLGDPANQRLR